MEAFWKWAQNFWNVMTTCTYIEFVNSKILSFCTMLSTNWLQLRSTGTYLPVNGIGVGRNGLVEFVASGRNSIVRSLHTSSSLRQKSCSSVTLLFSSSRNSNNAEENLIYVKDKDTRVVDHLQEHNRSSFADDTETSTWRLKCHSEHAQENKENNTCKLTNRIKQCIASAIASKSSSLLHCTSDCRRIFRVHLEISKS